MPTRDGGLAHATPEPLNLGVGTARPHTSCLRWLNAGTSRPRPGSGAQCAIQVRAILAMNRPARTPQKIVLGPDDKAAFPAAPAAFDQKPGEFTSPEGRKPDLLKPGLKPPD